MGGYVDGHMADDREIGTSSVFASVPRVETTQHAPNYASMQPCTRPVPSLKGCSTIPCSFPPRLTVALCNRGRGFLGHPVLALLLGLLDLLCLCPVVDRPRVLWVVAPVRVLYAFLLARSGVLVSLGGVWVLVAVGWGKSSREVGARWKERSAQQSR